MKYKTYGRLDDVRHYPNATKKRSDASQLCVECANRRKIYYVDRCVCVLGVPIVIYIIIIFHSVVDMLPTVNGHASPEYVARFNHYIFNLVTFVALAYIVGIGSSMFVAIKTVTRPINDLRDMMEKMASGDFDVAIG